MGTAGNAHTAGVVTPATGTVLRPHGRMRVKRGAQEHAVEHGGRNRPAGVVTPATGTVLRPHATSTRHPDARG